MTGTHIQGMHPSICVTMRVRILFGGYIWSLFSNGTVMSVYVCIECQADKQPIKIKNASYTSNTDENAYATNGGKLWLPMKIFQESDIAINFKGPLKLKGSQGNLVEKSFWTASNLVRTNSQISPGLFLTDINAQICIRIHSNYYQ